MGVTLCQGWKQAFFFYFISLSFHFAALLGDLGYGKVITTLYMISQPVFGRRSGAGPGEGFLVRRRLWFLTKTTDTVQGARVRPGGRHNRHVSPT